MLKLNQKGFAHFVIILVIIVAGVVGFAGWKVLNKKEATNLKNQL